jgi:hypothetical protein
MGPTRNRSKLFSFVLAAAAIVATIGCPPSMAETVTWPWVPTTNCAGNIGNKLDFRSVTVEPNTEVCVLPPSYQYSSTLRWYVGLYIGNQYFPETTTDTDVPRCATVAGGTTPAIVSSTSCTTLSLAYPGWIRYTPAPTPPSPRATIEIVDSPVRVASTSIALDGSGDPRIGYTRGNEAAYAYRTSGGWQKETVHSSTDFIAGVSLALDGAGYPHLSFEDNGDRNLKHAYRDGSGWHVEAVRTSGWAYPTSLALDSSGYPRITYYNGGLWYSYKDAAGWHHELVVNDTKAGFNSSLKLDSLDRPRIVMENSSGFIYTCKDTGQWVWEWPEQSGGLVGGDPSVALDSAGTPYLSYSGWDGGATLNYAYRRGAGDWYYEMVDAPGHYTGYYTSIALTPLGLPVISYQDFASAYKDLKMAYLDGMGWQVQTIDSADDVGAFTSIAVDNGGNAHISYLDSTNYRLKYAFMEAKFFDPDFDNDGINDKVDGHMTGVTSGAFVGEGDTFSNKFTDIHRGGTTYGEIVDRGGLSVTVDDIAPEGVVIQTAGITGTALINLCGLPYGFNAGSSARMTCGSATTMVLSADSTSPVEVYLSGAVTVLLGNGTISKISDGGAGQFLIENLPGSLALVAVVTPVGTTEIVPGDSGTVNAAPPEIAVTPTDVPFGKVLKGGHAEQTLDVKNEGGGPLTISAVGSPSAPFSLSGGTCAAPKVLQKDEHCSLVVEFLPDAQGAASSTLTITSDDPDHGLVTVNVSGQGILLSIDPEEGTVGAQVTITGEGFGGKKGKAAIGPSALKVTGWTNDTIHAILTKVMSPDTAYDVTVTPKEPKGVKPVTEPGAFTMKGPEIASVEPDSGVSGSASSITLKGKFFGNTKGKVTLERGGSVKSCKVLSWTANVTPGEDQVQFTVPKGLAPATDYTLRVANKVGSDTVTFAVAAP